MTVDVLNRCRLLAVRISEASTNHKLTASNFANNGNDLSWVHLEFRHLECEILRIAKVKLSIFLQQGKDAADMSLISASFAGLECFHWYNIAHVAPSNKGSAEYTCHISK